MKERIVITDSQAIDEWNRTIACYVDTDNSIYKAKFEKVPENFEELKELCEKLDKKLVKENNLYETQITMETDKGYYAFYQDGTIIFKASNSINYKVATNRTPSQMWQIIKGLIS